MPQQATVYRILVASPSDCREERRAIPEVVHAWNAVHSRTRAAVLEPVLWESHAVPELGERPQAIVNRQLVGDCDILVATFWTRWGTATGSTVSGTAEEIEEFIAVGKPVLLYFSFVPVVPDSIDQHQYAALVDYRSRMEQRGLVSRYESIAQLRELLSNHMTQTIERLHGTLATRSSAGEDDRVSRINEFLSAFESFLRRLDAEWVSERDSHPMSTQEGKLILSSALDHLLSFRGAIIEGNPELLLVFDNAARQLRELDRHQTFVDGGVSFREFWVRGSAVIESLHAVPGLVRESP